ncbi:MAG: tRNA pseudouridine(38-40) synthase TruA [Christensenellales bacterium]
MRIVLEISYIGTNYNGWQVQDGKPTIQGEVQSAIFQLTGEKVKVYASGRTDAGVHAYKQIAHFDTNSNILPEKFAFALNPILPSDIKVVNSYKVSDDFNARFDVKRKTYVYKFYFSKVELPLEVGRAYQVPFQFDLERMRACCKLFVGTFDFTSFCKVGKEEKDRVRTIFYCNLIELQNNHFEIEVCGNGFLHNMVRIIVGTIIDVAIGRIDLDDVKVLLNQKAKMRSKAGRTLPPYALYLKDVEY